MFTTYFSYPYLQYAKTLVKCRKTESGSELSSVERDAFIQRLHDPNTRPLKKINYFRKIHTVIAEVGLPAWVNSAVYALRPVYLCVFVLFSTAAPEGICPSNLAC